ncbi:MAG: hypothetical protein ACLU38_14795 [Dysosmobacter sp.]
MWESWESRLSPWGFVSLFYGGIPLVFGNPELIPFESFYNTTKAGVSLMWCFVPLAGRSC